MGSDKYENIPNFQNFLFDTTMFVKQNLMHC